jgi:NADH:ubiquinone oxidoreductase subunit 6 (subunit J)
MDLLNLILLLMLAGFALMAVFLKDLLKAAISLAFMSSLLAVLLYRLDSPFAAVFELSVVAGLITVLFVSVIALTKEEETAKEARWPAYVFPLALVVFGLIDIKVMQSLFANTPQGFGNPEASFGATLWGVRSLDILGQIAVIFGGVFGVLALLREKPLTAKQKEDAIIAKDGGKEKLW